MTGLTVCRLRAGEAELTERVLLRGRGGGPPIPGDELRGLPVGELHAYAAEAVREAEEQERAGVTDRCVDTDGRTVDGVAGLVRTAAGDWPGLR